MRSIPSLAINGKFLAVPSTGVHRVAAELAHALAALAAESRDEFDIEIWVPHDAAEKAKHVPVRHRVVRPLTHIPWEQFSLPFRDPGRLLLNLCNLGPVLRGNCVTMIHDAQVYLTPRSYSRPFRLWYKGIQPLLGRRHRAILTVSEYSRREIARFGICPIERIAVVPNGVDHMLREMSQPAILDRLELRQRRFVLGLASTQAHKNVGLLLDCFGRPELADMVLLLIGDGSAEAFADKGLAVPSNVVFSGRISDGELRALYEAALCLAFPSRTEGFGLPPLEGMLLGCPAIVAPCGALPEICGETALYAGPDAPEEWIGKIRSLADDPAFRAQQVALGVDHAREFTWRSSALRLLDALGRLRAPSLSPVPGESEIVPGNL